MIEVVAISTAIVLAMAAVFMYAQSRTDKVWLIPLIGLFITPVLPKIALANGVYAHPSSYLFASLLVATLILNRHHLKLANINQHLTTTSRSVLIIIAIWAICFLYGLITAWLRWGDWQWPEALRNLLYVVGLGTFIPLYIATIKLPRLSLTHIAMATVCAIGLLAAIAIGRVILFVISGQDIDYWQYDADSHAIGLLGQYIDTTGLQLIGSSANENAGWLYNLGAFISLALALQSDNRRHKAIWMLVFVALSIVMLFTLSRASLVLWYSGLTLLVLLLLNRWLHRGVALALLAVASLVVVWLFPNAPFVEKALNTVNVTQVVDEPEDEPTQSAQEQLPATQPAQATEPSQVSISATETKEPKISIDLEPSAQGRVEYWQQTLSIMQDDGWQAAVGQGEIDLRQKFKLVTHSLLLQNTILYGAVGLVTFAVTWLILLYIGWSWLRQPRAKVAILAIPLAVMLPGWLLSNLIFGGSFLSIELLVMCFGLIGVICAHIDHPRESTNP